jgi:hypothetical protein
MTSATNAASAHISPDSEIHDTGSTLVVMAKASLQVAISGAAECEDAVLQCCYAIHTYANQKKLAFRRFEVSFQLPRKDVQESDHELFAVLQELDRVLPLKSKDPPQTRKLQTSLSPLPWAQALDFKSCEIPSLQLPYVEELVLHCHLIPHSHESDDKRRFQPVVQRIVALKHFLQRHSRNRQLCSLLNPVIDSYEAAMTNYRIWPADSLQQSTPRNAALLLARVSIASPSWFCQFT